MTDERIELVDRDYERCPRDNPSRQIRTRKSSFTTIRDRFNAWRVRRLEGKLERKKEHALTQGYTEKNFRTKIDENAGVIARLEEKIMILSKQNVPTNYVSRRAIKLRNKMIENLTYNVGVYYSVGMEHYDEVYALEDLAEEKAPVVEEQPAAEKEEVLAAAAAPAGNDGKIDVVPSDLERKEIVDAINSGFEDLEKKAQETDNPEIISSGDVKEVINNELDRVEGKKSAPVTGDDSIDKEAVRESINEAFKNMEQTQEPVQQTVVPPKAEVPPKVETPPVQQPSAAEVDDKVAEAIRKLRVSRNQSTAARTTLFDENGNRVERHKKYNYKPMTNEEIRAAQIKLGFDEHGNLISNKPPVQERTSTAKVVGNFVAPGNVTIPSVTIEDAFVPAKKPVDQPVRVNPVVVPERKEPVGLELEDGENMFEVIKDDQKVEETPVARVEEAPHTEQAMTIDDYSALREKILRLRQQKELTAKNRAEAQKRADEAQARAQEARKAYEVSEANFNDRMERLRAYSERLQAACDENVRFAEEANRSAIASEGVVQEQRHKANRFNQQIQEIDSMMVDVAPEEAAPQATR